MERYSNKRQLHRRGGKFYKPTASDFGIGGACPNCRGIMLRHYDGDPRDQHPDPRAFRNRCFTCEPMTEAELKVEAEIEAAKPKQPTMLEFLGLAEKVTR